ncbi:MAG: hypothetical protein HDR79_09275 [Bacteroides sp.]|nr:hypothetical protein [Bacteroides sp.]
MNKPTRRSPDYLMRASWHDYRRPGAYLLTLAAAELAGPFSSVLSDETVSLSPVGIVIDRAIRELPDLFAGVQIPAYVIMPDHVHLVLRKVRMSPVSVGMVVAKLKSLVTQRIGTPQFAKGFNDKISFSKAQTAAFVCYVRDNPRRFRLRRLNPDYFVSRHTVEFGNQTLLSFGNPELLKHPVKCAVRYSRSYSAAEFKSKIEEWDEVIRQGGVLCSPFIHEQERKVLNWAIDSGASIILVQHCGFSERYKPGGKLFELCARGRLFVVALNEYSTRRRELTRADCLAMNEIAAAIAAHCVR